MLNVTSSNIPTFMGTMKNAKVQRDILGLTATHGLDDILNPKYIVPNCGDLDCDLFQAKNKFMYSVWISRTTGGMAQAIICDFEDTLTCKNISIKKPFSI